MPNNIEKEWEKSMDQLSFSAGAKDRICQKLIFTENRSDQMKKFTFKKAAAAIAICTFAICGTVLGAGKLRLLRAWSNSGYDFTSPDQAEKAAELPGNVDIPETLESGFTFDGANSVHVSEEEGKKWNELSVVFKNTDGLEIFLRIADSKFEMEEESRKPTGVRNIGGIRAEYNLDEYLSIPEGYELDQATRNRQANDDHFYINEGSEEPETYYFRSVVFHKDGIRYSISTLDDIAEDVLYSMAKQLILRICVQIT